MELAQEYRGQLKQMQYIDSGRVLWKYKIPMGEIIVDFYDKLKGLTKGYATMNYEMIGYEPNDLVRLDILINRERIEAFSLIVHKDKAYRV
jgi:GTP-binding protein LepA